MRRRNYIKFLIGFCILLLFLTLQRVSFGILEFYIFKNKTPDVNHFLKIAKYGDLDSIFYEIDDKLTSPKDGEHIKFTYSPDEYNTYEWVSTSWETSEAKEKKSYDLTGAKRLVFWARGEKGGEIIEFNLGSISLEDSNLNSGSTGVILLSDEWREYSIDLEDLNLSSVSTGFSFIINKMDNLKGAVFYLDEIKYEFWDRQ